MRSTCSRRAASSIPTSPEAQQFVLDYLTDTTMHEVGHTLGLRHNFRASRVYTDAQLSDPEFTRANGLAGSVMEYAPINLAAPGETRRRGRSSSRSARTTTGRSSTPTSRSRPTTKRPSCSASPRAAASRSWPTAPTRTTSSASIPSRCSFDLGNDPLAFAKKRFDIARDLIKRQETRELKPSEDYSVLRRSIGFALRDAARASGILARQIGGVRTLRDFPGSGRDPLLPVSAAAQREALDVLASGVLAPDSFVLSPALQRRMAPTSRIAATRCTLATDRWRPTSRSRRKCSTCSGRCSAR